NFVTPAINIRSIKYSLTARGRSCPFSQRLPTGRSSFENASGWIRLPFPAAGTMPHMPFGNVQSRCHAEIGLQPPKPCDQNKERKTRNKHLSADAPGRPLERPVRERAAVPQAWVRSVLAVRPSHALAARQPVQRAGRARAQVRAGRRRVPAGRKG